MLKKMNRKMLMLTVALVMALVLAACGSNNDNNDAAENNNNNDADNNAADNNNNNNNSNADEGDLELGGEDISLPYVAWAGETSRTPVLALALEKAGYNVSMNQVEAGPMWSGVSDDEDTLMVSAWLPATHNEYLDEFEDDIDIYDVPVIDKAPLALTVPEYMEDVNEIEDLKDEEVGDSLDWTITGIDAGAGVMGSTEDAIETYDLDYDLLESSEAAMIGALEDAIENEEPIVIPGWRPHWMFSEMDLKMLEDPEEVFGGEGDEILLVFNKDFKENHPAAAKIAERFAEDWEEDIENELMFHIFGEGEDEMDVAEQWVEDNADLVDSWIEGIN